MKKIIKVVCSMTMGYSPGVTPTTEKLTLTDHSIKFKGQYPQYFEKETECVEWSFRSNSDAFQEQFFQIADCLLDSVNQKNPLEIWECDTGIAFTVYFDDKSKDKFDFGMPPSEFEPIWNLIKPMIPPIQNPPYLLGGDD